MAIEVDLTQLIPSNLKKEQWIQFFQAFQSILSEIKVDKIDIIKTQYIIEQMTEDQILNLANQFGHFIYSLEGYTSEIDYLRKEVLTIIPRIINRNTRKGYKYLGHIFNLVPEVYPLLYENSSYLTPYTSWWDSNENLDIVDILDKDGDNLLFFIPKKADDSSIQIDAGQSSEQFIYIYDKPKNEGWDIIYLDEGDIFPNLDMEAQLDNITRHLLLQYKFRFVESKKQYMSANTAKVFYLDATKIKRKTELLYFEPYITINTNDDKTVTNQEIEKYDKSEVTYLKSQLYKDNLSGIAYIHIGDGSQKFNSPVKDVANLVYNLNSSGEIDIEEQDNLTIKFRPKITQKQKLQNMSEIALWDSNSGCILYATFPEIVYNEDMYGSIFFDVNLV